MATQSPTVSGKRVSDLRVTELRVELEQRGLETKGLKADLVKRLEKVRLIASLLLKLNFSPRIFATYLFFIEALIVY